jgi:hypothetical protein
MGTSPREKASADVSAQAVSYQSQFAGMALPEIQSLLSQISGNLSGGFGAIPSDVQGIFGGLETNLNQNYDTALQTSQAGVRQGALQSGVTMPPGAVSDAERRAAITVEQDRGEAMRRLKFNEATAGLGQFNELMSLLGGGGQTAINLGQGGLSAELGAIQSLPGMSQGAGAMSGATAGAGIGFMAGGPVGAAIGGVGGGLAGYFGSG